MIDLAYMTVIHRRHEIAARALEHVRALAASVADVCSLTALAVLSDEDWEAIGPVCDAVGIHR
ncbi:MAG: hypothetical protein MUP47_05280, partial [Phycisphaerae bacterium]|nr:hypothetical protein [Phycisphaerae bacterium]